MANTSEVMDTTSQSKRPTDSAFKQQRLPAWQPILTAGTVLPTFFVIGIAFVPVGIALLYFSDKVEEVVVDYTDCISNATKKMCSEDIADTEGVGCYCTVNFELPNDLAGTVYMYYGLSNFYQNHRRYVKSRDDNQLLGNIHDAVWSDCAPFMTVGNQTIAPCGAIANSMFNDVLKLYKNENGNSKEVPLLRTGIAWKSDKEIKFRNPSGKTVEEAFRGFAKPVAWNKPVWELDTDEKNNGFQNEDLIVWMRTAALPTFRKLYRRIDHSQLSFSDGLLRGNYTLDVQYYYKVTPFEGRKRMILSTTSLLGGKNPFLGIAYIVVGCICLLLGVIFLFIHIKCGKNTTEMINVNPHTPYQ